MTRTELIDKINSLKLIQKEYWEDTEFPQEVQEVLDTCEIVKEGLDVEKHRWYETSVVVGQLNGEYFGIRFVTTVYSESSSIEDVRWKINAFPMKAVLSVDYVIE